MDDHYIKPILIYNFDERTKKGQLRFSFLSKNVTLFIQLRHKTLVAGTFAEKRAKEEKS